ncbi:MAG: orotidine-5'-phosphate decarboxylase [Nocardioides sp.]|nr:orotidine-5'-phosphate decarboxylase [Nocardioides sp.]
MTFGSRLHDRTAARGPLCAGIDPHPALLEAWGLPDTPEGLERFALTAAEVLGEVVALVKPQSAFFERHGAAGVAVLERVVTTCRQAGALVLLDVKRGDIGSTSQAYADAYLDPRSPLAADAVTVSPYLGFGSLEPFLTTAETHDAGVFVLALTSNPEGAQVQRARTAEGRTVAGTVLAEVAARNIGATPSGSVGVVVGATVDPAGERLDVNGPILAPGVGAQGATMADVRRVFGDAARHVLPSSSREILGAGPERGALRDAARRAADEATELRR